MKRVKGKGYCPHAGRARKRKGALPRKARQPKPLPQGKQSGVVLEFFGLEPCQYGMNHPKRHKQPRVRRTEPTVVFVKSRRGRRKADFQNPKGTKILTEEAATTRAAIAAQKVAVPKWRQPPRSRISGTLTIKKQ